MSRGGVRVGQVAIDAVTFDEALERIAELVDRGAGGAVFTPNVDHVVKAEANEAFRQAYERADLCLADGMWILWAARFLGAPLPAKISGSDLIAPLARLAGERRWRLYILGGGPGVASDAAAKLANGGVQVVGWEAPMVNADGVSANTGGVLARLKASGPNIVLVALGAPKQELWIDRHRAAIAPAVAIGVGGSLDFLVGRTRRAPAWMSRTGLEWLFRLSQEPSRMWRRYLVEDPKFLSVVIRTRRRASGPRTP